MGDNFYYWTLPKLPHIQISLHLITPEALLHISIHGFFFSLFLDAKYIYNLPFPAFYSARSSESSPHLGHGSHISRSYWPCFFFFRNNASLWSRNVPHRSKAGWNKCSGRSMEVKLPAVNYDSPTNKRRDRVIGKVHFH